MAAGSTVFEYSIEVEAAAGAAKWAAEILCFELVGVEVVVVAAAVAERFAAAAGKGY